MEAKNIDVPQPDLKLVAHPRAKSKVWKYFGFDTNAEGCIMQWKKIYCRICMAQIAYSGNTSNLSYHLEKNHPDEFCEFVKSNTEQMREAFATAFSKLKPEASQQVVQETFILKSNHTFDKKQLEVSSAVVNLICEVLSQQDGKVAIITGGAKGIGYYTAKHLARLGMHVIIAGNNETDGNEAVTRIQQDTLNEKAGVMLVPEGRTEDGFEEHFGTNYLGHFLLTNLLLDTLRKSGTNYLNARVVTVSSATHFRGQVNFDDLQSSSCYSAHGAYAQSKLALVLFTYYLQHLLTVEGSHVTCNAVDPGVVNTDLYKNLSYPGKVVKWMTGWLLLKSAEEGAATSIYACVSPDLEGIGGCYLYNGKRIDSSEVSYNLELQKKLWTESCKMAALPVSS
ncbi:E3 SUMO-protein ligase ZBED1 isoform X5 [Engystomops pustulosus]|uniref:E3 SUMO-protein ligase ZBED1 isoform X5 n=1 Tax=Engystomops pustulosus TaxID=76066 RepID=UPI003AFA43D7